jgi:hypothetical protein
MCAPLFGDQETIDALGLNPGWEPQGVLIMGYPEGEPRVRRRLDPKEVMLWR